MKFLPDERLYSDTAYCLDFARRIEPATNASPNDRTIFHFYWCGDFNRKTAFALKSFLATQDLRRVEGWLWFDTASGDQEANFARHMGHVGSHIAVKRYDPDSESQGTPFAGGQHLLNAPGPAARSDAFRLLILHNHGGVYADLDTLFLRDFAPLLDSDRGSKAFCYRWSAQPYANSAILRLTRGSKLSADLIAHCRRIGSCHPAKALRHDDHESTDLLELPCAFFDPLWLHFDRQERCALTPFGRFNDFFRPFGFFFRRNSGIGGIADFFPGAFTYAWHNRWDAREVGASYFGMFEREIDSLLAKKFGP
jgi:hypothetical protein